MTCTLRKENLIEKVPDIRAPFGGDLDRVGFCRNCDTTYSLTISFLLYRMFFAPSRTTGVAAERTFAALGAGEYRSHTALASQKIIAGMVPDEEPHGLQYIARFPFRGYFCHLYASIRKLRLGKYPVKCLKQTVCQLHLAIYRVGVRF